MYEYRCKACGQKFEVRQKFSDEPLQIHEECGGEVERLLSAPALQFKGSGWYVTDYARNNGSAASGDSNGKSETPAGTKSEGKTENKSETKSQPSETKPAAKPPASDT